MEFPKHPFWDFSLDVHPKKGVHEACLVLQKLYALDINLLFFCCWVGATGGGCLSKEQMAFAIQTVEGWQEEIVRPIWKARWKLKPFYRDFSPEKTEPLRRALIAAEIDAEHIEQLHLADTIVFSIKPGFSEDQKSTHAISNICLYLNAFFNGKGIQLDRTDITPPLVTLVCACFPSQTQKNLEALILDLLK